MINFASFPSNLGDSVGATSRNTTYYEHAMILDDDLVVDGEMEEDSLSKLTFPGESLTSSQAYMRGHGTYVEDSQVVASIAGTVERVNKLITVRAIRTRYNPEVGDLIVGRITEVNTHHTDVIGLERIWRHETGPT